METSQRVGVRKKLVRTREGSLHWAEPLHPLALFEFILICKPA